MHIVEANDWKDAAITLLEPRSQCPKCHARRTMKAVYGMPATPYVEPWQDLRGCCVTDDKWTCSKCRHTW